MRIYVSKRRAIAIYHNCLRSYNTTILALISSMLKEPKNTTFLLFHRSIINLHRSRLLLNELTFRLSTSSTRMRLTFRRLKWAPRNFVRGTGRECSVVVTIPGVR